jgi:hypothetical protein
MRNVKDLNGLSGNHNVPQVPFVMDINVEIILREIVFENATQLVSLATQ